jgi:hypothetical protein
LLLQSCGKIWNVLQMVAVTTKKSNYKMCTSQHAFKDTLHCAHIPLNVPKSAQPLAQLESLGRGRNSFGEKKT